VAGYAIALRLLQSRSDMASLLSGLPRDERWDSINLRALSLAAQVIAVVLVGAVFAVAYLGGLDVAQARRPALTIKMESPRTGLPEVARMNEQMALIRLLRHVLELRLAAAERPAVSPI
jgi:hypothetical protein